VARIVLGSYMVRYPLGGMMSWVLQYLVGFDRIGHDVTFVEKSGYPNSCYDPARDVMSDDCSYGTKAVAALLDRFGLGGRWCFVDAGGRYHGLGRAEVETALAEADVFVDMGTHGAWLPEAEGAGLRVLIDGEPGFTQMKMDLRLRAGEVLPEYDLYYSAGQNVGTRRSSAPAAGKAWRHLFHPVVVDLFPNASGPGGAFTTVMNWQSYEPLEYDGAVFGHKDVEFRKFESLPTRTDATLEVAVSGRDVPSDELASAGWRIIDAHAVTSSFDSFVQYVRASRGEFSVCKSGYVQTRSGWFSDRSAAYLASGRPVVLQDTGFAEHLPCGEGLFAVQDVDEAVAALAAIESDYERHSRASRHIAAEHLDARTVLRRFLDELGL
jgi:hypothetical protein